MYYAMQAILCHTITYSTRMRPFWQVKSLS